MLSAWILSSLKSGSSNRLSTKAGNSVSECSKNNVTVYTYTHIIESLLNLKFIKDGESVQNSVSMLH